MEPVKCKDNRSIDEACLINTDCYVPSGEDRDFWYEVLREASSTLFQTAGGRVDVLCFAQEHEGLAQTLPQQYSVPSDDIVTKGIRQYLRESRWQHLIFIANSAFSWSQLSITEPAFRTVLADLQVFTPFLRLVPTFGAKTNDKQRTKDCLYYRVQPSSSYEICYKVRYFELNGRQRGNPWSLRQTGVYQRRLSSQQSVWFLLNYSNYMKDRVSEALEAERGEANQRCDVSSLRPHSFILSAAARNWGLYIESLRQTVLTLEEKVYSSSVDTVCLDDYALLYKDVQKVTSLSDTLLMVKTMITGQQKVLYKCNDLHTVLHKGLSGQCDCGTANTFEMLKADLQHHYNDVVNLAKTSSMMTQLLSAILQSRANEKLQATVSVMHTSIVSLQLQSQQTCQDTANLLKLSGDGLKDAAIAKILAQTATMFLPASLMASIFSSTVFGSSGNRSYVGLYFAITIPLLVVTLLLLVILEKGLPRAIWRRE